MLVARTVSAEQTQLLARALAGCVGATDVVLLSGDLGAGKTTFTKGFAVGLGITEAVTSPTFTIVRSYEAPLRLHHLDVYRVGPDEVDELGLSELLDDEAVTLIEWGDLIRPALGPDTLELRLRLGDGEDDRVIEVDLNGRWASRRFAVESALSPWLVDGGAPC